MPYHNIIKLGRVLKPGAAPFLKLRATPFLKFRATSSLKPRAASFPGLYTARSVYFPEHGKRNFTHSSKMKTEEEVEGDTHHDDVTLHILQDRVCTLAKGYDVLDGRITDGFKEMNAKFDSRFDKVDRRLDHIDAKTDGWVRWGVRVGLGLFGTVVFAIYDTKKEIHDAQKDTQKLIRECEGRLKGNITESEQKLKSQLSLAFVRELKETVSSEVGRAITLAMAKEGKK